MGQLGYLAFECYPNDHEYLNLAKLVNHTTLAIILILDAHLEHFFRRLDAGCQKFTSYNDQVF